MLSLAPKTNIVLNLLAALFSGVVLSSLFFYDFVVLLPLGFYQWHHSEWFLFDGAHSPKYPSPAAFGFERTPHYNDIDNSHKISRQLKTLLSGYNRVCIGHKTFALLHQYQRQKDEYGRIIAEMSDYAIAYQLMKDAFLEGLGQKNYYTDRRLALISKEGKMTAKRIAEITGVSVAAISQWFNPLVLKGILIWCDENGIEFADKDSLEKAKRSGKAYVRIKGTFGLPTPYKLTGDERWSADGELFREYDLELEDADDQAALNDAVVEVTPDIVHDHDKVIDFTRMNQTLGVNALSDKIGSQNKNIDENGGAPATFSEISAENLYDEFSGILSFN